MLSLFLFFFLHVYSIVFPLPIVLFSLFILLYLKYLPFALPDPLFSLLHNALFPGSLALTDYINGMSSVYLFSWLPLSKVTLGRLYPSTIDHRSSQDDSLYTALPFQPLLSFAPSGVGVVIAPLLLRLGSSTISVVPLHPAHTFVISSFVDKLSSPYPHLHMSSFLLGS